MRAGARPGRPLATGARGGARAGGPPLLRGGEDEALLGGLRPGAVGPFVLDGPINRDAFEVYAEKVLVPELSPGDVVVMDNLSSHKGPNVRALIEREGVFRLSRRPKGPTSNQLGKALANLRGPLGKAAERTIEGLWKEIGRLLETFTPSGCATIWRPGVTTGGVGFGSRDANFSSPSSARLCSKSRACSRIVGRSSWSTLVHQHIRTSGVGLPATMHSRGRLSARLLALFSYGSSRHP